MKLTKRRLSIITLALTLVLSLAVFLGINTFKTADAESPVTVSSSSTTVFNAQGKASFGGKAVSSSDDSDYYTTFSFTSDDDNISYRRNLAYIWHEEVTTGTGENAKTEVKDGYFSLHIGLKSTDFEKFVITFESQQYNKTKDGKAVNYVMFFPAASAGKVYALVTTDKDAKVEDVKDKLELDAGDIYIEFIGKYWQDFTGGYSVDIHNETGRPLNGQIENAGGNYAKYSSSSTTPVYPLIFNTVFKEKEGEESANNANVEMILYSLNGQEFKTSKDKPDTVVDNTAAVLCLNKDITYLELNGKLDIDYQIIDVLKTSLPSPTLYYYVLDKDTYNGDKDYNNKDLFTEKKSSEEIILGAGKNTYLPSAEDLKDTSFKSSYNSDGTPNKEDKLLADMLVKVYFKVLDTSSNGTPSEVYLDWYVDDEFLVPMAKGENTSNFIAVAKDRLGVAYSYVNDPDGWESLKKAYQDKVDKLAKNLSAGTSSYFYLPSPESLFSDNATAYTEMKFSIYYFHDSKQSNTGLSSNNLSINISKEHKYTFTIYATDAAGNDMYYIDKDGEIKEFGTGDIWNMFEDKDNEGLRDKLPWFTFTANYKGVEFEETPGMQSTAYVGSVYNFSSAFKINGISGSYSTKYRLFRFNSAEYYEKTGTVYSYSEFIDVMDKLYDDPVTHVYFEEILKVSEGDPDYDKYKDYEWNNSTSFVPQDADSFYYVVAEVKDTGYRVDPITSSLAVVASETAKTIKGESDWLKNNVASVVLLSVAVAALIGIVLLLVIKPKNKGDIDEQLEKAQKKSKKNKE